MKSFVREVVSMTFISIAVILILVLVFYDYLKLDTEANMETEYSRSEDVSAALADDTQSNQVIASFSKSLYSLDSADISSYIRDGIMERGKKHPFSDINDDSYDGINAINNNVVDSNAATVPVTTPTTTTTTVPVTTPTTSNQTTNQTTTSGNNTTTSTNRSTTNENTTSISRATSYSTDTSESSDSVNTGKSSGSKTKKKKNTKPFFDDGTSK